MPRIETFAEENSSKAIKRPNMGNIVIYGLCGEKRCAKGRQDKAVFGGALGCHVSAYDTRDSSSRIMDHGPRFNN
jgi:hypothetical protein